MLKRTLLGLVIAAVSAGWVVPLGMAIHVSLDFWRAEVWPLLRGADPINSFPYLAFAYECFWIAMAWLGAVVFFWSYLAWMAYCRGSRGR